MGAARLGDILATLSAVEQGLGASGYHFQSGLSLQAAQEAWQVST
jgi:aspartate aminotransferase-like enzyme